MTIQVLLATELDAHWNLGDKGHKRGVDRFHSPKNTPPWLPASHPPARALGIRVAIAMAMQHLPEAQHNMKMVMADDR